MRVSIHTMYFLPDFGSAPILMNELAGDLARRGHEVEVVTTLPRQRTGGFAGLAYSRRREDGFVVKRMWTNSAPHPAARLAAWNIYTAGAMLNLAAGPKPDVLLLRTPPLQLGLPAFWARALRGSRVLLSVQDIHPDLAIESGILTSAAGIRFAKSLEKWVYGLSDRIVVISEGFRRNLLAKGVPAARMSIIPNWVDTDFLAPMAKDNPVSRKYGLHDKFVLLYSGTISISSNVALEGILETAGLLAGEKDIRFVITGEGLKKESLKARASALGLENVAFLPFQPYGDLPALLASSDVLLVPLDSQKSHLSVPSKLYNFMAAGRPILGLATPDSEVAAILRNTKCGPAVRPGRPAEAAEAVLDLRRSPDLRKEFGANARAHVTAHFAKGKILESYDRLLRSMS